MTSFLCTLENLQGSFHENRELLPITLSLGDKNQVRNTFYAVEQMIRINKTIFLFFPFEDLPFQYIVSRPWNQREGIFVPSYIHHHSCLYDLQEDGGKHLSSIRSSDSFFLSKTLNKNIHTDIYIYTHHTKNIVNPVLWSLWNGSEFLKKSTHMSFPLVCHSFKISITVAFTNTPQMLSNGLSLPCTFVLLLILDKVLECSNIIELISA